VAAAAAAEALVTNRNYVAFAVAAYCCR
jgi:hypothetical protein